MKRLTFAVLLLTVACGSSDSGPFTDGGADSADASPTEPDAAPDADASPTEPDAAPDADADASPTEPDAAPDAAAAPRGCAFAEPSCGGEICIANQCEPAWGRDYRVSIYDAEVPALDPFGFPWDPNGTGPDLYVSVNIGGSWGYHQTNHVLDSFSATWTDASFVTNDLSPGVVVLFFVADNDAIPGDGVGFLHAFSCSLAISAGFLDPARGGGDVLCSTSAGTFHGKIEPL